MKTILSLIVLLLSVTSCISLDDDATIIEDPTGAALYFVDNQSSTPLGILFSDTAGSESQLININVSSAVQIYQDAIIGVNPTPADSFSEIRFFDSSSVEIAPLFVLSTIVNDDWDIVEQQFFDDSETLALTTYSLVITDSDLE